MDLEKLIEAKMIADLVDDLDYYQVLKVPPEASRSQIKQAYYRESRVWHPDNFYGAPDEELKASVNKIATRITEAYTTLREAETREAYDRGLALDRSRFLRYSEELGKVQKEAREQDIGTNPKARELYRQAGLDMEREDWLGAEKKLKMAMAFEPGNETYKARLKDAQSNIKTDYTIK